MSHRLLKINELLRSHLANIICREIDFKSGVLATVTKVETSPDLRSARVGIGVLPEDDAHYVIRTLQKERKSVQGKLHSMLSMKPMPKISFFFDPTESRADVIEHILIEIGKEGDR